MNYGEFGGVFGGVFVLVFVLVVHVDLKYDDEYSRLIHAVGKQALKRMQQSRILLGMGLVAASASTKLLLRVIRESKTRAYSFNSSRAKSYIGPFKQTMNRSEAARILNIKRNASEQEIMQAHRRLIMKNHPDSGGSTYITIKINEAKDIMLLK